MQRQQRAGGVERRGGGRVERGRGHATHDSLRRRGCHQRTSSRPCRLPLWAVGTGGLILWRMSCLQMLLGLAPGYEATDSTEAATLRALRPDHLRYWTQASDCVCLSCVCRGCCLFSGSSPCRRPPTRLLMLTGPQARPRPVHPQRRYTCHVCFLPLICLVALPGLCPHQTRTPTLPACLFSLYLTMHLLVLPPGSSAEAAAVQGQQDEQLGCQQARHVAIRRGRTWAGVIADL